jgi:hypothetical protein
MVQKEIVKEAVYRHYKDTHCFDDIEDFCVSLFFFICSHNFICFVNVSFKQPLRSRPIDLNEGITTPPFPEIQLVVLSVI